MILKSNKQLDLINTAKKYLDKCEDKKISTTLSSLCYLNNFDISAGYIRLRIFNKQFNLNYLFYLVKNLLLLHRQFDYKIINKNNFYKKKNKLIISWARSRDFNEEGIFIDRYLNLSSKNKKIFFFLIYLEKKLPEKIEKYFSISWLFVGFDFQLAIIIFFIFVLLKIGRLFLAQ